MRQQVFDDGSSLWIDGDGNILGAVNNLGIPQSMPGPNGSPIVQQFAELFNYGVRGFLDSKFRGQQIEQQQQVAAMQFQMSSASQRQMMGLALIVAGALVVSKLLSR